MARQLLFSFCFLFVATTSFSQHTHLGSWSILNVKYTASEAFSFFGEGQIRSLYFYSRFHYYEYKAGLNYKIQENTTVTVGAGSYQTYKETGNFVLPKNNDEFRIWPQIALSQSIGKLKIEHRYRAEFRFTGSEYRNRFRFRLGLFYPFGNEENNFKPYQVSVSNELFFTDNEPYFERNRLHIAFSFKPSKTTAIQLGYLHQFDYKLFDETGRDFLQVGYSIELFRNQNTPAILDAEIKD